MEQQKKLNALIDQYLQTSNTFNQILAILSSRVDMPKNLVQIISKKINNKNWAHIQKIFQLLQLVSFKFQGGISLYTQISNKEFLFKISSLLNMKDISESCKQKIIDTVFCWKKLFKPHQQLLPAFSNFITNFQSKGYVNSNPNFQTTIFNTQKQQKKGSKLQDLLGDTSSLQALKKLDKTQVQFFKRYLQRLISVNKIIDHTDHQMLDFPPVIKQKMGEIKMGQPQLNKQVIHIRRIINDSKSQKSLQIALSLTDMIRLSQKRYTQLITRYMPQKFQLSKCLIQFNDAFPVQSIKENIKPPVDLLNMAENDSNLIKLNQGPKDLLDFQSNQNLYNSNLKVQPLQSNQTKVNSFFNNLLGNNNKNNVQKSNITNFGTITLQQNDFRTDMDFKQYDDTPAVQKLTKKLTDLTDFDVFQKK